MSLHPIFQDMFAQFGFSSPKTCPSCQDLDELEKEYPDEPHHGATLYCGECEAEYYEEYGGTRYSCNEIAKKNHPKLKAI